MHILMVADGRSPITQRWCKAVAALGHQITLVSTFPCPTLAYHQSTHVLPVAFANLAGSQSGSGKPGERPGALRRAVSRSRGLFLSGRYVLGPLTLPRYGRELRRIIAETKPDLVHALRVPFEGMLAAYTPPEIPLVVSIWGNDLTYHARGSLLMRALTEQTLRRADGLLADARRDLRLGQLWGFQAERPSLAVPGGAGIDLAEMHRLRATSEQSFSDLLPAGVPLVVNPRGFRPGSVRNDVFFQAIPLVLERMPKTYFTCTAMAGQAEALQWIERLKIWGHIRLLPHLPQSQLWDLFNHASVLVSISAHDGTPNSFLEGLACGCFPVVGDIESLREWVIPGVNGYLVPPDNPAALAEALVSALSRPELRSAAAEYNLRLIQTRAEASLVRAQIEVFYNRLVSKPPTG